MTIASLAKTTAVVLEIATLGVDIETQRQKQFERTESRSEFFREYILLHNIWKGCSKNMNLMLKLKVVDLVSNIIILMLV